MNRSRLYGAVCAFVFGFISIPSHAELIDNGGGLIYDTVLDITWAQPEAVEARTWDDANTWAAGLTLGGVGGWRLPYISVAAGAGPLIFSPGNPPFDCFQSTEEQCRDNELGYMFRYNLGGSDGQPILLSGDPDLELFPNLQSAVYWSGTEFDSDFVWVKELSRQTRPVPGFPGLELMFVAYGRKGNFRRWKPAVPFSQEHRVSRGRQRRNRPGAVVRGQCLQ